MSEQHLNRAERRKRETRASLLGAAAQLLADGSYADLSVRAIADLADVGYGTFYLHFEDKDEIVWEIMVMMIEQTNRTFSEAVASLESPMRELVALRQFFTFVRNNKDRMLTVLGRNGSPKLAARYRDAIAQLNLANLQQQKYSQNGGDVPLDFAANFASGAQLRLAVWWLENEIAYTPHEMAEMFFRVVYQMEPPGEANSQPHG